MPRLCGALLFEVVVRTGRTPPDFLVDALYFSGFHAFGADFGALDFTINASSNLLNIRRKGTICHTM